MAAAQEKAAEQDKKVTAAHEEWKKADDKVIKAEEDLKKALGGRDYDDEIDKLDDLETKHAELTEKIKQEKQAYADEAQAAKEAAEAETKAAIEMAQAQNYSQQQMEDAVALLERKNKKETDPVKFAEQAEAIDKLITRLKETTGEWMSLEEAERLVASANQEDRVGFIATQQQMQQATQALERHRDKLVKTIQAKQRDGEATKEEEEQLKKLERELKDLKFEQDNFNMSHKRMNDILKEPKSAGDIETLRAAIKRADGELQRMDKSLVENNKRYQEMAAQVKAAKIELGLMERQSKATASAFEKAWSRLKTYVGLYVGAAVAMQKLTATMGDLMELSDKMGEVRKTTGMTADEVGRLTENLKKMDVRTSLVGLMEVASSAGTLGLKSMEDIEGFVQAANKLMIALPEMGREAATEMMRVAIATGEVDKIRKQLQEGTIEGSSATAVAMEKIASTIDRLRASSASTAPEITEFVKRVGAVGSQSGITIDQVAALGSTISGLGMRVEMSATALSRMIPAIKNNAFSIGQALGVTPDTIRNLFDTGRGMEAILMIFQRIKDQGLDDEGIEKMLGMGGMQDIMKELNQQGARAGIVFAGLSQNVDELRRQLGVASQAYEENIAIQQEFDRMNETTAAKWERLKNQLEEAFVGDSSQKFLGGIIDGLRAIIDLLTGEGGVTTALKTILIYLAAVRVNLYGIAKGALSAVVNGLKYVGAMLGIVRHEAVKLQMSNAFTAIAAAVAFLVYKIYDAVTAVSELDKKFQELQETEEAAEREVNRLTTAFTKTTKKVEEATKKHKELEDETNALRKEVDEMKKSTNLSTEAQEAMRKKEEELRKKEGELKTATDELNKSKKEHNGIIAEINSKYSTYLGYMLSEATNADLVASAHWRIVAALRSELEKKRQLENQNAIEQEYSKDIKEWTQDSRDELKGLPRDVQNQIMKRWSNMMSQISYDIEEKIGSGGKKTTKSEFTVPVIDGLNDKPKKFKTYQGALGYIKTMLGTIVQQEAVNNGVNLDGYRGKVDYVYNHTTMQWERKVTRVKQKRTAQDYANEIWGGAYGSLSPDDGFQRLGAAQLLRMQKQAETRFQDQGAVEGATAQETKATLKDIQTNASEIVKTVKDNKTLTDAQIGEMSRELNAVVQSSLKYGGNTADVQVYFGAGKDLTLGNAAATMLKDLDPKVRQKVLKAAQQAQRAGTGGTTNPTYTGDNPWGENQPATSTNYADMNAEQLVARRKQMKEFVNAIQTDTDIEAVLKEDAALQKAIAGGLAKNFRSVVEWYNTERLKIQDELHARHLTNTGDWQDPKQEKARKKRLQEEWKAYLDEIDAYYTERKAHIQEAATEEGVTEAEVQNRTLANEIEWRQRRAALQKMYADRAAEVTREEQEAIFAIIAERQDDTPKMVERIIGKTVKFMKDIGQRSESEIRRYIASLDKGAQQDLLRVAQTVQKQMKAIQDIIDKERPFNGITKNLRENLVTMGILTADMTEERNRLMSEGKDMSDFNARQAAQEIQRTAFMLGEAENAYSTTIEEVMRHMADAGLTAWADELRQNPKMQEGLMASLRTAFDQVQEAIKKESSIVKKQVDIIWNDALMPDGQSMKQAYEQATAALGQQASSVQRANSLIGAGESSARVADRLAIRQMQIQMQMQEHYYNLVRKRGLERIEQLKQEERLARERGDLTTAEVKRLDAEHAARSLNLALTDEQKKLDEQRVAIAERLEESQNRLYTQLREWGDLLAGSLQSVFEASHAGEADYYNELAKLNLTGKGGPGAGTYVVIDNAGTSDAEAHYEYLDERQALERQLEIERENAQAEAWKKVMDDLNGKMSEQITDWLNASLQNASVDANTQAVLKNTEALAQMSAALGSTANGDKVSGLAEVAANVLGTGDMGVDENGVPNALKVIEASVGQVGYTTPWQQSEQQSTQGEWLSPMESPQVDTSAYTAPWAAYADASNSATKTIADNNKKAEKSTKASFAAMTAAANMYGIAYQTMSNENLSTTQKVEMMIVQAAGQAMISMLTASLAANTAETEANAPSWVSKTLKELGPIGGPVAVGVFTALIGGLLGMATSKITKSKSQIAQATGASSASAGKLTTGMLTYAEGNVNEFTDPSTLTVGRSYNVDAADGRTYRARYMGNNPRTHLTNGPEFHLSGERGREMIIDAGTTRQITMNDNEIWRSIQTLSSGGRLHGVPSRRRRGVRAFAEGNVEDFSEYSEMSDYSDYSDYSDNEELRNALDRNSAVQEALLERLSQPIQAKFDVYGRGGLIDSYDRGKKTVVRHGERY